MCPKFWTKDAYNELSMHAFNQGVLLSVLTLTPDRLWQYHSLATTL